MKTSTKATHTPGPTVKKGRPVGGGQEIARGGGLVAIERPWETSTIEISERLKIVVLGATRVEADGAANVIAERYRNGNVNADMAEALWDLTATIQRAIFGEQVDSPASAMVVREEDKPFIQAIKKAGAALAKVRGGAA